MKATSFYVRLPCAYHACLKPFKGIVNVVNPFCSTMFVLRSAESTKNKLC